MARDQVRCIVAAAEGRVLNIGTELSVGVCDVSSGHLRFVPREGIVGNRDIDVLALARMDSPPEPHTAAFGDVAWFRIATGKGDLLWGIPPTTVDWTIEKLALQP